MPIIPRRQPLLVNQFRRLVQTSTPSAYKYGDPWNDVIHGHDYDAENCMATQGAIAAAVQSGFTRSFSPGDIRDHQGDLSGGIGLDDVNDALGHYSLPPLDYPSHVDYDGTIEWVKEGRYVVYAVEYSKVPRSNQAQKGGNFDHALGISDWQTDGTVALYDSLAKTLQRVDPQTAVRAAAQAVALRERGDSSRLFAGATVVLPELGLVLRYGGQKTHRYPDKTRAWSPDRALINVHDKPRTGKSSVVGQLEYNHLFIAYQYTMTGDPFDGSTKWYGNKNGSRWISAKRLSHEGGAT